MSKLKNEARALDVTTSKKAEIYDSTEIKDSTESAALLVVQKADENKTINITTQNV